MAWKPTIVALAAKKFNEIKVPANVSEAVEEGQPMVVVSKLIGVQTLLLAIELELAKAAAMINIDARLNIQPHQLPLIAQELYEQFKTESIEDFMLCFKRGSMGLYDDKLLRLDGSMVFGWMRKYLEEKYTVVDSKVSSTKKEENENKVDYAAYAKRMSELQARQEEAKKDILKKERERQIKDMEYEEMRKSYTQTPDEHYHKQQLHIEWIKASFDPITREKLPGYMDEEEWIQLNKTI